MLPSLLFLVSSLYALLLTGSSASPLSTVGYPLTVADPRIPGAVEDLSGSEWTASAPSLGLTMPGTVPGDVITDLFHAGVIPEPLYELNWLHNRTLWNDHTWLYNRTVQVAAARVASLMDAGRSDDMLLVMDGIKMGADIYVNNVWIARSIAQFERHVFSFRALLANKTTAGALRAGANTISVVFDPSINTELFMQCTGGWDWAPYSNTTTADGKQATFSRGIWKSVYMVYLEDGLAVTDTTPLVTYRGPFPNRPLSDGEHAGFTLNVTLHTMSVRALSANVSIQPSWRTTPIMARMSVPAGMGSATVLINVNADEVLLWWPSGLGAQPLYDVDVSVSTSGSRTPLRVTRRVGFRYFAIVTGNDTSDAYVAKNANATGTDTQGMRFRINGAPIFARGANVIPMDNQEGRYTAAAHRRMVWNARDGGMNIMRIWGGGVYLPSIFYATADEAGLMVYHDLMNRDHFTGLQDEVRAYRDTVRRLATHPSIVIWDGCNECDANQGEIGTTVMSILTNEDSSRAVWPSCPAQGWVSGVNRLSSHPDGTVLQPAKAALIFEVNALGRIEQHGPYQHGDGWPAVNGDNKNANKFDPMLPLDQLNPSSPIGLSQPNLFTSEFGSVGWSSFESLSPTVAPNHWALHGGAPPSNCNNGQFPSRCEGDNVMSQRNYPCDSIIFQYFGGDSTDLDVVGEMAFKKQLYQCLYGQALVLRGYIEQHRATNTYGLQIWQLNEIWPTGGWGTIEYGTVEVAGQVEGGRWKPAHYWLKDYLFTDRIIACGKGDSADNLLCYIRNDVYAGVVGTFTVYAIDLATSAVTTHYTQSDVALASGPGAIQWITIPAASNPNSTILRAVLTDPLSAAPLARNTILLTTPQYLALQPVQLTATVVAGADATADVYVAKKAGATAVWVTLTTQAQGRFSENAFVMAEDEVVVQFIPFGPLDTALLRRTLRVETANQYASTQSSSGDVHTHVVSE